MDDSNFKISVAIMDDLCSRYLLNIPEDERKDLVRLFFAVETAHWDYLDTYCAENGHLKQIGIRPFSDQMFRHCPYLAPHYRQLDKIRDEWKRYKLGIATYGAVLLNQSLTQVLLVRGFGPRSSWGFPKGKVNENETEVECAIREVLEETGYDIKDKIDHQDLVSIRTKSQETCLYVITGVPTDIQFHPKTVGEIKDVIWFYIDELPQNKAESKVKPGNGNSKDNFFMVIPFVSQIRQWIERKLHIRRRETPQYAKTRHPPTTESPLKRVAIRHRSRHNSCESYPPKPPQPKRSQQEAPVEEKGVKRSLQKELNAVDAGTRPSSLVDSVSWSCPQFDNWSFNMEAVLKEVETIVKTVRHRNATRF